MAAKKITASSPKGQTLLFQATLEDLKALVSEVLDEKRVGSTDAPVSRELKVYTNADLKRILGVGDKLILKYRNDGLLGFSKVGDKFFYTEQDLLLFMERNHVEPYAYE